MTDKLTTVDGIQIHIAPDFQKRRMGYNFDTGEVSIFADSPEAAMEILEEAKQYKAEKENDAAAPALIERKLSWYKDHHSELDDLTMAEAVVFQKMIAHGEIWEALYDCYRFAFVRGYEAAQRENREGATS